MQIAQQNKVAKILAYVIMAAAMLLYAKVFWEGRDLFLDELNLSRNVVERSYFQLFGGLDYQQHAPPFFLFLLKICTQLFGVTEYALRLLPFAAGVVAIPVFYLLSRRFLDVRFLIFPLLLFSFSMYMMEYAVSVKQYSMDVLLAILFLYWGLRLRSRGSSELAIFTICGALGLWFSMPLIFVLASIGLYFLHGHVNKKEGALDMRTLFLMGFIWLLSFGILYTINISSSLDSENLMTYHQDNFIPFPDSVSDITRFFEQMMAVFRSVVGKTAVPILFAVLLFLTSLIRFIKDKNGKAILLVGPFVLAVFASMLGYYAFAIRLTLFFLPGLMITMGLGLYHLYRYTHRWPVYAQRMALGMLLILSILCLPQRSAIPFFVQPFQQAQSKKIIQTLQVQRKGSDPILITHNAEPAYKFYTEQYDQAISIAEENVIFADWSSDYKTSIQPYKSEGATHIWLLDSHSFGVEKEKINEQVQALGAVQSEYHDYKTDLYYLKLD